MSVLSRAEASFVASLVKNNVNTYPNIWIGLHDPTEVWTHLLFIICQTAVAPPKPTSCPLCLPSKCPREPWSSEFQEDTSGKGRAL